VRFLHQVIKYRNVEKIWKIFSSSKISDIFDNFKIGYRIYIRYISSIYIAETVKPRHYLKLLHEISHLQNMYSSYSSSTDAAINQPMPNQLLQHHISSSEQQHHHQQQQPMRSQKHKLMPKRSGMTVVDPDIGQNVLIGSAEQTSIDPQLSETTTSSTALINADDAHQSSPRNQVAAEFAAKVAATLAPQSSPAGSVTLTPDKSTSLAAITAASDGGKQQLALQRETSIPQHPPGVPQHLLTDDWLKHQTLLSSSSSVIIEPPSSAQWQQGSGSVLADERIDSSQPPAVVTVHTGSVTVSDAPASVPAFPHYQPP